MLNAVAFKNCRNGENNGKYTLLNNVFMVKFWQLWLPGNIFFIYGKEMY